MKKFDSRTYSVSDFVEWDERRLLEFSPDFQRRSVWSVSAKSYLMDTILREYPIPKVIMQQSFSQGKQVRTVIDGQQRIRTVLEFMKDAFTVLRSHNPEVAGKNTVVFRRI